MYSTERLPCGNSWFTIYVFMAEDKFFFIFSVLHGLCLWMSYKQILAHGRKTEKREISVILALWG